MIVSNFENFYNKELNRRKEEELRKEEEQRAKKEANESKKNSIEMERMIENDANGPREVLVGKNANDESSSMLATHTSV